MSRLRINIAFLFVLAALLGPASGQVDNQAPSPTPPPQRLTSDTPRNTPDGAKFIAPGGWSFETRGKAVILTPEGDSMIALVDLHEKDPDAAVKSAWAIVKPDMKWALKLATDAPGREGWDSFRRYDYEVSPNEHRAVGAQAAKRGDAFTVVVIDMDQAVAEKRSGQVATLF